MVKGIGRMDYTLSEEAESREEIMWRDRSPEKGWISFDGKKAWSPVHLRFDLSRNKPGSRPFIYTNGWLISDLAGKEKTSHQDCVIGPMTTRLYVCDRRRNENTIIMHSYESSCIEFTLACYMHIRICAQTSASAKRHEISTHLTGCWVNMAWWAVEETVENMYALA